MVKNTPPMQGIWVQSPVQEDPTCHRATKKINNNNSINNNKGDDTGLGLTEPFRCARHI